VGRLGLLLFAMAIVAVITWLLLSPAA